MLNWLNLSEQRRKEIINNISFRTGLAVAAIEKDWYVTLALHAVFQTQWATEIVFKGGTSLSKAWRLINRFSEDVDYKAHSYPELAQKEW
jgi:predicted nucleotidyltransferase component of viral defense system